MILVGNQRGGAKNLALHLLKEENDHVEVHELRGFASDHLVSALNEAYAISRGTRCKQFLFSLSLNPPPRENVATEAFERAIDQIEEKLGLTDQPRAIVFHEKDGRRHAHAVWSRIDTERMKAVQLSFTHRKLQSISCELFIEHGWQMPRGLVTSKERDPRNFTLAEWQQANRIGQDPRTIKADFQDAWAISDSKAAFAHALEERGYRLARGDRRGFVAVDYQGEVYAIPKWVGVKTKQVRERLGDESDLPCLSEIKKRFAEDMLSVMEQFRDQVDTRFLGQLDELERRRKALVQRQRSDRQKLKENINLRHMRESQARQARFRKGLKGLWDRLRGEHRRIRQQNEREAELALKRDQRQIDELILVQLGQGRALRRRAILLTHGHENQRREIETDISNYVEMMKSDLPTGRDRRLRSTRQRKSRKGARQRGPGRGL